MTRMFLLQHVITRSDDDQDVKIIGIYETEELARAAVQRLKDKPGFQDARGEFSIGPYILNLAIIYLTNHGRNNITASMTMRSL